MIVKLEHAAVGVSDMNRSIVFYCELLGFEFLRIIEPREDERLGVITGMPGAQARIAHLKLGDSMLELFEYKTPLGRALPENHRQADKGLIHFGIRSNDLRGDYRKLKEKGVSFISEPVEFRPGVWVVYFKGPDGEMCELREDPAA